MFLLNSEPWKKEGSTQAPSQTVRNFDFQIYPWITKVEHQSTDVWISVAMPSSRRYAFLKRCGWWKILFESLTVQSIPLHHFSEWQILSLLGEKGHIVLKNFFYLVSFWSFLSSVFPSFLSFIHKIRLFWFLILRRFNDCLIWKWVVYSSMILEHCSQINQSISCPFLSQVHKEGG